MTITFERPVGAHLDVKELEYIASLHQSGNKLRPDASIACEFVVCSCCRRRLCWHREFSSVAMVVSTRVAQILASWTGADRASSSFSLSLSLSPTHTHTCSSFTAADDVIALLMSRHGIRADKDLVEKRLMPSLAGAMGDNPSAVFDIVELVSILVIPNLKKVANQEDAAIDQQKLFGNVLKMILSDVYGSANQPPPILNRETMIEILETYDEVDVSPQIIDEMLRAAGVQPGQDDDDDDQNKDASRFNIDALMNATTGDVSQFNDEWVDSATTHYDDVFHGTTLDGENDMPSLYALRKSVGGKGSKDDSGKAQAMEDLEGGDVTQDALKRVFTFPTIDYVAENYSSKFFVVFLWVLIIVTYFVYLLSLQTSLVRDVNCDRFRHEFACRVANAILSWVLVFVQLR